MAKQASYLVNMLRNVTGRIDQTDPLFTDEIMLGYLNDFIQLLSPQDIRIFKNKTWYEFTIDETSPDPFPVNLQTIVLVNGAIGATTLEPPAYADGFNVFWYQNPQEFYALWPESQTYTPQRPQNVLWYNNELTFRGPPNEEYLIKIAAYQVEFEVTVQNPLQQDYIFRYVVYGAALDIFSDYGEMEKWKEIFPAFQRYRSLVYARTSAQYQNQRAGPEF